METHEYIFSGGMPNGELLRLCKQDSYITSHLGVFPEQLMRSGALDQAQYVVDLACGPGGWLLEAPMRLPSLELGTGIDIDKPMLAYATAQARVRDLQEKLVFTYGDVLQTLPFGDGSVDIVHARLLESFLPAGQWPHVLAECWRILKPTGFLFITESELPQVNHRVSPAYAAYIQVLLRSLHATGKTFGGSYYWGITTMLPSLLRQAQFQDIHTESHFLDFSYDQEDAHATFYENIKVAGYTTKPFIIRYGGISEKDFDALYEQLLHEMVQPSFIGTMYLLRTWGRKIILR